MGPQHRAMERPREQQKCVAPEGLAEHILVEGLFGVSEMAVCTLSLQRHGMLLSRAVFLQTMRQ